MKKSLISFILMLIIAKCFSQDGTDSLANNEIVNKNIYETGNVDFNVQIDTINANRKIENELNLNSKNSQQSDLQICDYSEVDVKKLKTHKENLEWVKIVGIYTASVVLNAMGDGFNNSNKKTLGHVLNGASIGLLVASPFLVKYDTKKWYWYLASYVSLRVGLFDVTYNATRGLPFNFTGTTSPTDKAYNKMEIDPNVTRSLCLTIGMSIPIALL